MVVLGNGEHALEDQCEGVQGSGKTDTGVWAETLVLEKANIANLI